MPEGMCVLYGPAEADGSLPSEPAAAAAEASELDIDCFSADAMQYTAELAVAPGTRYAYAVVTAGGTPDAVYHFRTNEPGRLRAVAVSDTHLYSARAHEYHPAILEATLESALEKSTAAHEPIDMIVHTGDILDYPEYSLDMFFEGVPMLRSFLLAPVSGNHDSLYAVRRRLPMAGQDARTGNYWICARGRAVHRRAGSATGISRTIRILWPPSQRARRSITGRFCLSTTVCAATASMGTMRR